MEVISAEFADIPDCQAIYAYHVLHGTGTFEEIPPSVEDLTARFASIKAGGHAWMVARDESGCLGFGYYGPFRARAAYRHTVEDSVYVRDGVRGQGVGKAIVTALIADAASSGFNQMLALIGDSQNVGSIGVHASLGFQHIGTMRKVGYKFDTWLDVVTMQKTLA